MMKINDLKKMKMEPVVKKEFPKLDPKMKMEGYSDNEKDQKILEATKKFEGLFLQHLMNEMMKSTGDQFMGKGLSGDIFKGIFVEKMSEQMTQGRGLGLSDMVYDYFEKTGLTNNPTKPEKNNE